MSTEKPLASDDESVATDDTATTRVPASRAEAATLTKRKATPSKPLEESPEDAELAPKAVVEPEPSNRSFWARIDRPFLFGFLVTLGALAALLLGLALTNLSTVIVYIALALFAALGLDPAVRFLERRGIKRGWSVLVVLFGLIVVLGLIL